MILNFQETQLFFWKMLNYTEQYFERKNKQKTKEIKKNILNQNCIASLPNLLEGNSSSCDKEVILIIQYNE